jgi:phosphate transport system substrate-binding protein
MEHKTLVYFLIILLIVLCPVMYFVGSTTTTQKYTQTITIAGSTTVFPIAQGWAEALQTYHRNLDVQVSAGGSSVGIASVGQGLVDIGMASRQVKSSELTTYPNLINYTVALDGIAIVVNPGLSGITNLTLTQIKMIYNGTYTHWNNLSAAAPVVQILRAGRASTSGTYEFFYDHVIKKAPNYAVEAEFEANAGVRGYVQTTPNSIGYVGLGYVSGLTTIPINVGGLLYQASKEMVQNFTYPISRPLFLVTNGPPANGSLVQMFINFALSIQGQLIVERPGIDYVALPYVPYP